MLTWAFFTKLKSGSRDPFTHVDAVIISDYNKGLCKEFILKDVISKAKELQIPVFVDR